MNPGSADSSNQQHDQLAEDFDGPIVSGHMHRAVQVLCFISFPIIVVLYALHQLPNIGRKAPRFDRSISSQLATLA